MPVFTALLVLLSFIAMGREELTVGILSSDANGRYAFNWAARKFEADNPGAQVKIIALTDDQFKRQMKNWFKIKSGPDVITWHGGERFYELIRKGWVRPLDEFWQRNNLGSEFDKNALNLISVNNKKFGIPLSYYSWGFYYRKSLFDDLNISAPTTWQELFDVCNTLNKAEILPIAIGTKTPWTASAWFSYITLRLHGLAFYNSLIAGDLTFSDKKVIKIFQLWKTLLDSGCFPDDHQQYQWNEIMPSLFRKMAGMTLIGSFFTASVPESLADDFAYFSFPSISPEVQRYELAPLDLMMIPSYSSQPKLAEKFLLFLAQGNIQGQLNEKLQMLPANINADIQRDYFTKSSWASLITAQGTTQFLDRDIPIMTANSVLPILSKFMIHEDIERTITELENARLRGLFKTSSLD